MLHATPPFPSPTVGPVVHLHSQLTGSSRILGSLPEQVLLQLQVVLPFASVPLVNPAGHWQVVLPKKGSVTGISGLWQTQLPPEYTLLESRQAQSVLAAFIVSLTGSIHSQSPEVEFVVL